MQKKENSEDVADCSWKKKGNNACIIDDVLLLQTFSDEQLKELSTIKRKMIIFFLQNMLSTSE